MVVVTFNKNISMSHLPYQSREKQIDTVPEVFLAVPQNVSPYPTHHIILSLDRGISHGKCILPFYYFTFAVNIFQPDIMLEAFHSSHWTQE